MDEVKNNKQAHEYSISSSGLIDTTTSNCSNSWVDSSSSYCFFAGSDHDHDESSILSEFGWNLHQPNQTNTGDNSGLTFDHQMPDFDQTTSGQGINSTSTTTSTSAGLLLLQPRNCFLDNQSTTTTPLNPSVSSSSSEEQPEKSTGSDGKPLDKP